MPSAGDNESTAVQAPEDQLAARRARGDRSQNSTRKRRSRPSAPPATGPIDPNAGTGLIENIVCDPEPAVDARGGETVDEVLDRYAADSGAPETPQPSEPAQSAQRGTAAGYDEIEAELDTYHERQAARPEHSWPRGSVDLSSGVAELRRARRRGRRAGVGGGRLRGVARPWAAAIIAVIAVSALVIGIVGTGAMSSAGSRAASDGVRVVMRSDAGTSQTLAASAQVSAVARARTLIAEQIQKRERAAAKHHPKARRRHRKARRRAPTATRDRARAPATVLTTIAPAAPPSSATPSPAAASEPVGSTTTTRSSVATHRTGSSTAGPTGIGSVSGGCNPKCS